MCSQRILQINEINYINKSITIIRKSISKSTIIYITKTPANTTAATDPASAKRFETAPFSGVVGASDGGAEIDDGEFAGASNVAGDGDGGEFTVVGEGAEACGEGTETGGFAAGDGTAEVGDVAAGGDFLGESAGDDAGDCAIVEPTNIAAISKRIAVLE
jgi:hypothetical protein